jgi:hypothetical protein
MELSWPDRVTKRSITKSRGGEEYRTCHNRRKGKWIAYILRKKCLLKRVIEGYIKEMTEVTGRRERRGKKLLDLKEEKRILEI